MEADATIVASSLSGSVPSSDAVAEAMGDPIEVEWLGTIGYREAWALQKTLVADRAAGAIPDRLLLLEHPAVLTLGRGADEIYVRATANDLAARGIEVIRVERGGEVTYHGPGQLVAYPILALSRRGLLIRPLVRALEAAMVDTCAAFGVAAGRRDGHPGCWCGLAADSWRPGMRQDLRRGPRPELPPAPRKIGALGLRVERGVSYHGIALNVSVDLRDFALIDPCGMPGVDSTSIAREAGQADLSPTIGSVAAAAAVFGRSLAAGLGASLDGDLPASDWAPGPVLSASGMR
jgi:lipoyl(octanoyl) transferase